MIFFHLKNYSDILNDASLCFSPRLRKYVIDFMYHLTTLHLKFQCFFTIFLMILIERILVNFSLLYVKKIQLKESI